MKNKKEKVLEVIRTHINGLTKLNRFEMAKFYCEIATKIFYNETIDNTIKIYLNEDLYDVDKAIMNYVRGYKLSK